MMLRSISNFYRLYRSPTFSRQRLQILKTNGHQQLPIPKFSILHRQHSEQPKPMDSKSKKEFNRSSCYLGLAVGLCIGLLGIYTKNKSQRCVVKLNLDKCEIFNILDNNLNFDINFIETYIFSRSRKFRYLSLSDLFFQHCFPDVNKSDWQIKVDGLNSFFEFKYIGNLQIIKYTWIGHDQQKYRIDGSILANEFRGIVEAENNNVKHSLIFSDNKLKSWQSVTGESNSTIERIDDNHYHITNKSSVGDITSEQDITENELLKILNRIQ